MVFHFQPSGAAPVPAGKAKRLLTGLMAGLALGAVALAPSIANAANAYPRNETLYSSGAQWGNIVGFNPYAGTYATYTIGFAYETLYLFNPITNKYVPWLASDSDWSKPNVFEMTIRKGVKWSDGTPFTPADVKWNIDLGRFATIAWNNLYKDMSSVKVEGDKVVITFKNTPPYQQWYNQLWNIPMVQPAQWKDHATAKEITSWSPKAPIGTGPYVLDKSGYDPTTRVVWTTNPEGWWAAKDKLVPSPKPKYVIDLVNSSNNVALGLMLSGQEDLNNNYLPGLSRLLQSGYDLHTYYDKAPYMQSYTTVWLVPNDTKKPMSDLAFRKALSYAINTDQIAKVDYGNMVPAASPTGLLPTWDSYVDKTAVKQYGITFDPAKAKQILEQAGYKMGSDGYFTEPDGTPISLKLEVPSGWSDWMQAAQMISADAKAAGIKIAPSYPDYNTWVYDRNSGNFDLLLNSSAAISDTPFTQYQYLYNLPVLKNQTTYNYARYEDPKAWNLVQKLNMTPKSDKQGMQNLISELQTTQMQNVPQIPLWYNGAWAQMSTKYWKDWPSAKSDRNYLPLSWGGTLQMSGIYTITNVVPAGTK